MKPEATKTQISLGRTVITANAIATLDPDSVQEALRRHATGDWGDLSPEDRQENDLSAREGFRILSAYTDTQGTKFWIITEADRSSTTVLLPEDY
ncbi:MAG: hypothetical protein RLZZ313_760 [Verrucomicrobiota bacterium]|jgi:hypothetical protein